MRIRPALILSAALVFIVGACAPQEDDTAADTAAADSMPDTTAMQAMSYGQEHDLDWEPPAFVESCADVGDVLTAEEQETERLTGPIQIFLDSGGQLAVKPEIAVVERGDTVRFASDDLQWVVRFVGDRSPMRDKQKPIRGQAGGGAQPQDAESATVPTDAACGRYVYVVAARHAETNELYLLDPPLVVRD